MPRLQFTSIKLQAPIFFNHSRRSMRFPVLSRFCVPRSTLVGSIKMRCCENSFRYPGKSLRDAQGTCDVRIRGDTHLTNWICKAFCHEVVVWRHLRHRNILPLLGIWGWEEEMSMISPWMSHGNILQYLKNAPNNLDRQSLVRPVVPQSRVIIFTEVSSWWESAQALNTCTRKQ